MFTWSIMFTYSKKGLVKVLLCISYNRDSLSLSGSLLAQNGREKNSFLSFNDLLFGLLPDNITVQDPLFISSY